MQKQTMESGVKEKAARWRASGVGYERPYFAFLLNTPALLIVVLLAGYPIVYSAWISLHRYNLQRPHAFKFVGISNYTDILQSPEFWTSLWITVEYTVLVVILVVVLGILIALQSRYGLLLLAVVIPVQAIRAHQETKVIEYRFGDKYREYRQGTWF